jgi:RNA polymerase sigma-70 factor, ECF subfamily
VSDAAANGLEASVLCAGEVPAKAPSRRMAADTAWARDPMNDFLAQVEHQAYRMAHYALWDHELALDIVQDSMLKLVQRYREKPPTEWPALFFTILNNRINDARRQRLLHRGIGKIISLFDRRPPDGHDDAPDPLETEFAGSRAHEPETASNARRTRRHIDAAVGRLPARQRQVFLLRETQGLGVQETARILGCSEGAVKQHHFRALQTLRVLLAEVWDHEQP